MRHAWTSRSEEVGRQNLATSRPEKEKKNTMFDLNPVLRRGLENDEMKNREWCAKVGGSVRQGNPGG